MAWTYITTAATTILPPSKAKKVHIQVNAALTGTVTVVDGATTMAIITNPGVGSQFEYWDFQSPVSIVTDAACNITVSSTGQSGRR